MKKRYYLAFVLVILFVFVLFTAVEAQRLDFRVQGFGGLSGGSTDDENKTGELGFSGGGGVAFTYYFQKLGRFRLGTTTGLDFMYLTYKSETDTIPPAPPSTLTSDTNYSYLVVPITFRGSFRLNDRLTFNLDAGPFLGLFLGGKSKNDFDPDGFGLEDGEEDLNKDTTEQRDIGIRLNASLEMPFRKNLRFSPGILFDLGFSDTSKDQLIVAPSKDTFWKLGAYMALIHNLF